MAELEERVEEATMAELEDRRRRVRQRRRSSGCSANRRDCVGDRVSGSGSESWGGV